MEFIIIFVVPILAAILAKRKNRSAIGWFFLCLFIFPCIIILLILDPISEKENEWNYKVCPYCQENVKIGAIICKHCHKELEQEELFYCKTCNVPIGKGKCSMCVASSGRLLK